MITSILALLASTTFIVTAIVIILIAMAILLEFEKEGWATTFFSLGIALVLWNFKTDIWALVTSNPTATIGFAVSYVLIGIVWSFLKWRSYVKGIFEKFKDIRIEFTATNGKIDDDNRKHFNQAIVDAGFKGVDGRKLYSMDIKSDTTLEKLAVKITPLASKKKAVITAWISYWPVSLGGTILNNPFRQFFEWIYSNLSGYYDKITKRYQKDAFGF
jgi:hypothetical protein